MPINLGNPEEIAVMDLAREIVTLTRSHSEMVFTDRPVDDPEVRCPDISFAASRLGWKPSVSLHEGLQRTIAWAEMLPTRGGS
jgi:dTDP-glucose 4,6-dehydratase